MNNRAKVKVLLLVSGLIVCAYVLLPGFSGQAGPRQLDTHAGGQQQDSVRSFEQGSSKQSGGDARGATRDQDPQGQVKNQGHAAGAGQQPLAIPGQQGLALKPGQVQRALILKQEVLKQAALQQRQGQVFNQNQNIFGQHQQAKDTAQAAVPQPAGAAAAKAVPIQVIAADQGVQQQGGGPNAGISDKEAVSKTADQVEQPDVAVIVAGQLGLHPDVKIVSSYLPSGTNMASTDCVPLPKSPRAGVKICIYPTAEDKWVSGSLKMNKLWEEDLVLLMQRALMADPNMMLLDLGSNLGMYSLFAAAMGRSVLAVEMLPTNVAMIQKSLQLSALSGKVLIVNNALYRDHRILQTKFMAQNIGGSRLNTSKVYEHIDSRRKAVSVRTICLDDLSPLLKGKTVFMKIDIENSEHHALACAHKLFAEVNVKVVQIEWLHRTPEETTLISDFMKEHGYALSKSCLSYLPVPSSSHINKADVYFLKKSAFNIS